MQTETVDQPARRKKLIWIILLAILIMVVMYFLIMPVAYSGTYIKTRSHPIGAGGSYCIYKIDARKGKEKDAADTGSSIYQLGEVICFLCDKNQAICTDSIGFEDMNGRRYDISLVNSANFTCGNCVHPSTPRKIKKR